MKLWSSNYLFFFPFALLILCSECMNTDIPFVMRRQLFMIRLFLKALFYLGSKILILISVFLSGGRFQQDLFFLCIYIVPSDSWPEHACFASISIQLWLFYSTQWEYELVHKHHKCCLLYVSECSFSTVFQYFNCRRRKT